MNRGKSRKQSRMVLRELRKESSEGLELAKKLILSEKIPYKKLRNALEYYVSNWNDITHPGLFALAYESVNPELPKPASIQAAIAMIAAAFDIHDDIIDKSVSKHGRRTVFGRFGEEIALLLGNAFLIEGFTLLGKSLEGPFQEKTRIFEIIKESLYEFGNAHAMELGFRKKAGIPTDQYLEIFKMKAASMEGDMRIGALVGEGTDREVEALASYGRILGMLAILREEYIDVFDVEELKQRLSNEYLPLPIMYAMQDTEARKKIENLFSQGLTSANVGELADMVFGTKKVGELEEKMKELVAEATRKTFAIRNRDLRDKLQLFASSALEDI